MPMNTTLKPIPELETLSEEQRDLLHGWIDELGYRKAIARLKSELGLEITYNKLYRYYKRVLHKEPFDEMFEDEIVMADFLDLLNGKKIPYDQTGIELIMKRAFDLSCAREITPAQLASLLRIFHYK